ncbi:Transport system permease protein OS=Tsukamurella paurometabola (strain ATCC 8368 / DSM / CCUG 35730 / CIP 100753 / JCM 10117 / KCTC 9821 / NBRC 16120 /NCIMB 702349 / NCTC 13040) OX=521096 GN=Tpau_3726 PE=3 SV=1 [Tsukamurella paurometabola]|uniref:Transport system permease protein n=1 Tax=Tsukamurella paurometabola (strain ATCC 8368 / DSM 20162 / CCUG 35730 / CIP 100753 / JCM 10117 / KCTC 9821 / NBRC 16120 / NCIMB 702349 / NCTC 13040) TaxID=521096 RepID=D5UYK1_TSUPD|nr:iron ABC transporter permease [Tsukamurella paurometabola]ADG80304.1 transport system permease protein [Tsukamurella paurometabola DSM 20162]SUP39196.1 Iron(III) dicitrate transport system permease protein fecD [Tsukamurella paurometabola]
MNPSRAARHRAPLLAGALAVALVLSAVFAVSHGAATIPFGDVPRLIWAAVTGGLLQPEDRTAYSVVWELRVPRVLLAALVGAGLSIAGVACQALVRNPLADPFILGISSGASVGASLVVTTGVVAGLGIAGTAGAAFGTALLASGLVYLLSRSPGGALSPVRLVLTGVVLAFAFQGLAGAIVFFDPVGDAARSVMFWLLGGLGGAQWSVLPLVAAAVLAGALIAARLAGTLDVLAQGDEAAASLGLDPHRARLRLFLLVVAMTSVLVAVAGTVGFVGLVVPHAVRMILGPGHSRVLLLAPLVGALLLVWVDLISRLVVAPRELPLGIVSALVGVPVFLYLLRRRDGLLGGAA